MDDYYYDDHWDAGAMAEDDHWRQQEVDKAFTDVWGHAEEEDRLFQEHAMSYEAEETRWAAEEHTQL